MPVRAVDRYIQAQGEGGAAWARLPGSCEEYPFASHISPSCGPAALCRRRQRAAGRHGHDAAPREFVSSTATSSSGCGPAFAASPDHLGAAPRTSRPTGSYLPRDHAANLAALIADLELRGITLVVQDWGGPTGLAYAVAHPENVARLVISNVGVAVNHDPYYIAFSSCPAARSAAT
ncbi:MAG: hypothetical protein U0X20_17715 [Caldilineaceae bacterium]